MSEATSGTNPTPTPDCASLHPGYALVYLPLRQRQFCAERGKAAGEGATQPAHRLRPGHDTVADKGREQAVDHEYRKRHRHERSTQFQHPQQWMALVGGDELR